MQNGTIKVYSNLNISTRTHYLMHIKRTHYLRNSTRKWALKVVLLATRATFSRIAGLVLRHRNTKETRRGTVKDLNQELSAGGNRYQTDEGIKRHLIATKSTSESQKIIELIAFVLFSFLIEFLGIFCFIHFDFS